MLKVVASIAAFIVLDYFVCLLVKAQHIIWLPKVIKALTSKWHGKRLPDGSPDVFSNFVQRLKSVTVEGGIWEYLQKHGYKNQYVNFPRTLKI
jgi:hypothetical protein